MKTVNKKEYQDWKDKNKDPYGAQCFIFAEKWAELMEDKIASGEKIADVASKTSHEADDTGITGFMYGMAVNILSKCWQHGEELRLWHNLETQIGTEGEKANEGDGVLNPAILNISK